MITRLAAVVSLLSFRLRSRAALELEVVALRHQLSVLRRQRPGRVRDCWALTASAGDRGRMAPQGLPALLAVAIAITRPGTAQDQLADP